MSLSAPRTGENLLLARAVELARPVADDAGDRTVDLLVLRVGDQRVAVPLEGVREVRPPSPLARLPGCTDVLVGLVGGSGEALAVAALAGLLAIPGAAPPDRQWVAVLHHPPAPLGLLADTADDILTVGRDELSAPPESHALVTALAPDGTFVLDLVALLRDSRLSLHAHHPTQEHSWHGQ